MEPTTTKPDWKIELEKIWTDLQTVRDEIRVNLHLGGMDAKDAWRKLEGELENLPRTLDQATEASKPALRRALEKLNAFSRSLL